jgi:hypothetical protein
MPRFLVFSVQPQRQGVGNMEGLYEPPTWEAVGGSVEAEDGRAAIEARKSETYGEMLTAIPVEAIEAFYGVERHYVLDTDDVVAKFTAAIEQAKDAAVAGVVAIDKVAAPSLADLRPRPLVTVHEVQEPVDVVLGRIEDREENAYPENSTLDEPPPRCPHCGFPHPRDVDCQSVPAT